MSDDGDDHDDNEDDDVIVQERECKESAEKLRRELTRCRRAEDPSAAAALKFPVKDSLVPLLDPTGPPRRALPPLVASLGFPLHLSDSLVAAWNFLFTFR